MIAKVQFQNLKSLRDVTVDLERLTVIVGPNASGKSSILQGLDWICKCFRGSDGQYDGELKKALSRGSTESVSIATQIGTGNFRYRPLDKNRHQLGFPANQTSTGDSGKAVATNATARSWNPWTPDGNAVPPLPMSVLLRLETSKLVQAGPMPSDPTMMLPDGQGLHTALASMTLNDPDSWVQLQGDLKRIIPTIRRLRHTPTSPHQPSSLLFDTIGADSLQATDISEGTLLVLGLLAALYSAGRPNLVLLDDLDRGLHPKAQQELIALLRGLLDARQDLQIVASTHSPYLLDSMKPNEVRMTVLNNDGSTACAPLMSHREFPKWKDEMTPGEMWSMFGEKWQVESGAVA